MIKTFFLTFLFAIIVTVIATYYYLGGNKDAKIHQGNVPNLHLIYKYQKGSYSQTSFTIDNVEKLLKEEGILCEKTFGLFLDSPDEIKEEDLRSWAGCVFKEAPLVKNQSLHYYIVLASPAIVAEFGGSPALGPIKVYDKVKTNYGSEVLFPSLEIYSYNEDDKLESQYYFNFSSKENLK